MNGGRIEMLTGHLPEILILLVMLVGVVWLFGLAIGRGIARGKGK